MVADHESRHFLSPGAGIHHRADEIVIVLAFIGEAPAFARHRDHARLGAVDQVKEPANAAVLSRDQRHRHPGRGIGKAVVERRVDVFGHAKRVSRVALGCQRSMRGAGVQMFEVTPRAVRIVRKAAGCKYDPVARVDANGRAVLVDDRARNAAVLLQQFDRRGGRPQRYGAIQRRLQQARRQRIAIDEANAASVDHHVAAMRQYPRSHEQR